jgi:hypothetical protein
VDDGDIAGGNALGSQLVLINPVLSCHIKPAPRLVGVPCLNWQVLRRSYGTWMVEAGADPKAVEAQMRHARISTTMIFMCSSFLPRRNER